MRNSKQQAVRCNDDQIYYHSHSIKVRTHHGLLGTVGPIIEHVSPENVTPWNESQRYVGKSVVTKLERVLCTNSTPTCVNP